MNRRRFLASPAGLSATVLYGPFVGAGGAASQQIGALSALWAPVGAKSFPVATDVETAGAAIEAYLG